MREYAPSSELTIFGGPVKELLSKQLVEVKKKIFRSNCWDARRRQWLYGAQLPRFRGTMTKDGREWTKKVMVALDH
jgi:hypothetical protein